MCWFEWKLALQAIIVIKNSKLLPIFTELPGKPGAVSLTVASETSLFVRFIEPSEVGKLVVTKYKSEYLFFSYWHFSS